MAFINFISFYNITSSFSNSSHVSSFVNTTYSGSIAHSQGNSICCVLIFTSGRCCLSFNFVKVRYVMIFHSKTSSFFVSTFHICIVSFGIACPNAVFHHELFSFFFLCISHDTILCSLKSFATCSTERSLLCERNQSKTFLSD